MRLQGSQLGHSVAHQDAERWLYRDLHLMARDKRLTAVIGPNGSGKSTLLRALVGIEQPQQGRVTLDDTDLRIMRPPHRAKHIAYLPQTTPLYFDLTVRDIVMLGRAPHVGRFASPSADDIAQVEAALTEVRLADMQSRGVFSLSGGERQRVMLARMLATQTQVLVLDEPTTALDIGHALDFLELCKRLSTEGRTVVVAMHELDLARRYADVVICLDGGSGVSGNPRDVITGEIIEPIFGVRVQHHDDAIAFYPACLQSDGRQSKQPP